MSTTNVAGLLGDTRAKTMYEVGEDGGCKLNLKGTFGLTEGNVKSINAGGNLLLYQKSKKPGVAYYIEGTYAYKKLNNIAYEASTVKFRFDWNFLRREKSTLGVTAMATGMHSDAIKVDWRVTGGGGPQFVYRSGGFLSDSSLFVLGEGERGLMGIRSSAARLSFRQLFAYMFENKSKIGIDSIFATNFENPEDIRWSGGIFAEAKIWGPFSLGVTTYYEHDAFPLPGIKNSDISVKAYLGIDITLGGKNQKEGAKEAK